VYHRAEPGAVSETIRYLFFGTGNQEFPVTDSGTGKFYAIKDTDANLPTTPVAEASLTNVSANLLSVTNTVGTISDYGWFVSLDNLVHNSAANTSDNNDHIGEKVLSDPVIFYNYVYFTTFEPDASNPCGGGGVARVYGINMINATKGLTGLTTLGESDSKVAYHVYSGGGMGGIPSSPSLSINPAGQSSIFVGFSTGAITEVTIQSPTTMKTIKSWKETF